MGFDRLLDRLRSKKHPREPLTRDWIDPTAEFSDVIERERMRSDRSGKMCSLVVFTLTGTGDPDETLRRFAEILEPRLRATDHAGCLGEATVGVMLWDTSAAGATTFIDTLFAQGDFATEFSVEIFAYPTGPSPADRKRACSTDAPYPPAVNNATSPTSGMSVESAKYSSLDSSESSGDRPVHPLELLFVRPLPLWKRSLDIVGSITGLVLLSPLLAVTALLIKWTSPGPVFFKQLRDGLAGRQFTIYKFRTMTVDAEAKKAQLRCQSEQDGPAFKMTHDPRVTPLGRYLRKTCIDELPQLWNVLKGDMTLVGPRPLDSREAEKIDGWGQRRIEVTPGLTCIWQVHGKSKVSFSEWMRMDIRYLKRRTLWQDAVLVVQTAIAVLFHRGSC